MIRLPEEPTLSRFAALVSENAATGCWDWLGSTNGDGYARFYLDKKMRAAHRLIYEWFVGPLVAALEIDHLCRNRACVNPAHLEQVTHRVNMLRGRTLQAENAGKTHCKRGHQFTPENTKVVGDGWRACRRCAFQFERSRRAAS